MCSSAAIHFKGIVVSSRNRWAMVTLTACPLRSVASCCAVQPDCANSLATRRRVVTSYGMKLSHPLHVMAIAAVAA